jgi:hypothetical protein
MKNTIFGRFAQHDSCLYGPVRSCLASYKSCYIQMTKKLSVRNTTLQITFHQGIWYPKQKWCHATKTRETGNQGLKKGRKDKDRKREKENERDRE